MNTGEKIGYRLEKSDERMFDCFIGKVFVANKCGLITECDLHYIDIGQNDKISFYGNKEFDLCLRFEDMEIGEEFYMQLTDVFKYPVAYEKSAEQIENEKRHLDSFAYELKEHINKLTSKN
ncbi:MAG: hypothetical protein IPO78_17155 [Saprospiraceae bacterium]|nr:hypothetical protein [Saprospiraceae bacterium]